jgi:hypothetical protein
MFLKFLQRKLAAMPDEGKQKFIERGSHKGKGIAVFTSGGDSQGNFFLNTPDVVLITNNF